MLEIFTIGDNIKYYHKNTKIKSIYYNEHNQLSFKVKGISAPLTGVFGTSKLEKIKKVLFTTEDGVDIFEGDKTCWINNWSVTNFTDWKRKSKDKEMHFSTKEKAVEFVVLNKPCLSINNVFDNLHYSPLETIDNLIKLVKSKL